MPTDTRLYLTVISVFSFMLITFSWFKPVPLRYLKHDDGVAIVYLVVALPTTNHTVDMFIHSASSVRRLHPHVPVHIVHSGLDPPVEKRLCAHVVCHGPVPLEHHFKTNRYWEERGWALAELDVLALKIHALDIVAASDGVLLLDVDTELLAPLDDVFASHWPRLACDEAAFVHPSGGFRDYTEFVRVFPWSSLGLDVGNGTWLRQFNTGAVFLPGALRGAVVRLAQRLLATIARVDPPRGDNRLDEQLAVSLAAQLLTGIVSTAHVLSMPEIRHLWREKYRNEIWFRINALDDLTIPAPLGALV